MAAPIFVQSFFSELSVETDAGDGNANTWDTSVTLTVPAGGIPADHFLTILIALSADDTAVLAQSAQDTRGNTYTFFGSGGPNACYAYGVVTTPLQAGDTITTLIKVSSSVDVTSAAYVLEFSGVQTTSPVSTSGNATNNHLEFPYTAPHDPFLEQTNPVVRSEAVLMVGFAASAWGGFEVPRTFELASFEGINEDWNVLPVIHTAYDSPDPNVRQRGGLFPVYHFYSATGSERFGGTYTFVAQGSVAPWQLTALYFKVPVITWVRNARAPSSALVDAVVEGPQLKVRRYNDAAPPTIQETVTVETSNVTRCSLTARADGILDLLFVQNSVVMHRISRDGGRNWDAARTVASSYQGVVHVVDEPGGRLLIAMFRSANNRWDLCAADLGADGITITYRTPTTLVSAANANFGDFARRKDGRLFFLAGDTVAVRLLECRKLPANGAGTWTEVARTTVGNQGVALALSEPDGVPILMVYANSLSDWFLQASEASDTAVTYGLYGAQVVVTDTLNAGALRCRPDGRYEFEYVTGGDTAFLRCGNLRRNGIGTWSATLA